MKLLNSINLIKKLSIIIIIFSIMVAFTACAVKDAVEINEREYLFAVGIDINENSIGDEDKYTFTAEIPILISTKDEAKYIITQNCNDLTSFYYNNILMTEKIASDSIMQVIVIGEKVLKDPDSIKLLIDEIERSPQINRKIKLVTAKGIAADIINFNELGENMLVGRYISEFLVKLKKLSFQSTYSFDEIALYLQGYGNTLMPAIEIKNDRLSVDGAAVINNYELKDYINHDENGIVSMLTKGSSAGMSDMNIVVDGTPVSLTYDNVTVSQDIDLNKNKLRVRFYVTLYFNINSYTLTKNNISDNEFQQNLCNKANLTISHDTNKLISKIQNKYKTDILGIEEDLIKYNNNGYNSIKDKYEEVFCNADINVYYNVKINNSGMVK